MQPRALFALILLLGFYTAGHTLANAKLRYSVTVMPLFMVLPADALNALATAALGLSSAGATRSSRNAARRLASGSGAAE